MKTLAQVLSSHPQIYRDSCVGWGFEAIALMHDLQLSVPYEFQEATQISQGKKSFETRLLSLGVKITTQEFGVDFGAFERKAKTDMALGYHPLITVPCSIWVRWETEAFDGSCHTLAVSEDAGRLVFLTWSIDQKKLLHIPLQTMTDLHVQWLNIFGTAGLNTGQLVTGIFHEAVPVVGTP
jgi:hypothetical protein